MFRNSWIFLLAFVLAGSAFAADRPANAEPVAQPGEVSRDDSARAILEDHMRSELDWRSYFTNRMAVQLRARSAEKHLWQEPRAASVK
ncbi:MAG: hypothetical protein H6953_07525 [Chromatiaceae bacterium]|nr:hypothetical protein [Chromatiaceae bacterium]MCP5315238.1 hypothetical protein [Chromatiaceae bacterium]